MTFPMIQTDSKKRISYTKRVETNQLLVTASLTVTVEEFQTFVSK